MAFVYNPNDPDIYLPYRQAEPAALPPMGPDMCNYCNREKGLTCVKTKDGTCARHRRDPTIRRRVWLWEYLRFW